MNKTIWSDIVINSYNKLEENIECDVLIIGGGLAGVLSAYFLKNDGFDVVLVEMDRIGQRKTVKTTAVVTALQDVFYHNLIKEIGLNKTKLYLDACTYSIKKYKELATKIDFDYEEVSSYKYFKNDEENLKLEVDALKKLDFPFKLVDKVNLPLEFDLAIEFSEQGQFNPMKLIKELIKGIKIYENTKIIKLNDNIAYTENHLIRANKIVVTTGFPFMKFKGLYSLKMYQNKSYVITVDNNLNFKGNIIGSKKEQLYFRDYNGKLIIGGNDIETGYFNDGFLKLKEFNDKFNKSKIDYQWVNQDCITLDDLPYIGQFSYFSNHLYVATGFNLWGMTGAMLGAMIINDIISKTPNKYQALFNPSRLYKIKPLAVNLLNSLMNIMTFNERRCNHLGCSLVKDEDTDCYECPCHGSKYESNGKLLDGPAIKNLKNK